MITMEEYAELLPAHNQIINYYMKLAKSERENEGSFNKKVKKALRKDLIKRINEAIDVINHNFKIEKKNGNNNVKLSKIKYKSIKNTDKAMKKLEALQNKVNGFLAYSGKGQTVEENNISSEQQSNTATVQTNTVEQQATTTQEVQAQQENTPAKEPDAIEGQMDIEELESGTEQAETTEKAQTE